MDVEKNVCSFNLGEMEQIQQMEKKFSPQINKDQTEADLVSSRWA